MSNTKEIINTKTEVTKPEPGFEEKLLKTSIAESRKRGDDPHKTLELITSLSRETILGNENLTKKGLTYALLDAARTAEQTQSNPNSETVNQYVREQSDLTKELAQLAA
jgi:hypothetical protein